MNKTSKLTALAALIALSGVAQASDDDRHDDRRFECSAATLRGLYVFSATGFNITPTGVALPKAITLGLRFNGDGTLTVATATIVVNGAVVPFPPNFAGSYAVESDCSGRLQFGPNVFNLIVALSGRDTYMNQTGNAPPALGVLQGRAHRVSR